MNENNERIVSLLEKNIGIIKVASRAVIFLIGIPVIVGVGTRSFRFDEWSQFAVVFGILLVLMIPAIGLMSQKIELTGTGVFISGPFRRNRRLDWDEVASVNYGSRLRWIVIRDRTGIVYFNSIDGLDSIYDFLIIIAYRTNYRCPEKLRLEVEEFFDSVDLRDFD